MARPEVAFVVTHVVNTSNQPPEMMSCVVIQRLFFFFNTFHFHIVFMFWVQKIETSACGLFILVYSHFFE